MGPGPGIAKARLARAQKMKEAMTSMTIPKGEEKEAEMRLDIDTSGSDTGGEIRPAHEQAHVLKAFGRPTSDERTEILDEAARALAAVIPGGVVRKGRTLRLANVGPERRRQVHAEPERPVAQAKK